jgi:hypothetical protein
MSRPNQEGQANISPEHGAELWQTYIEPLKYAGYYLVSPACTSAPSGIQWIQDWLSACNGQCNVNLIRDYIMQSLIKIIFTAGCYCSSLLRH